eukprot:COSAG06_NODE_64041_length_260_cov_1.279503_1_plen_22_part_10
MSSPHAKRVVSELHLRLTRLRA